MFCKINTLKYANSHSKYSVDFSRHKFVEPVWIRAQDVSVKKDSLMADYHDPEWGVPRAAGEQFFTVGKLIGSFC